MIGHLLTRFIEVTSCSILKLSIFYLQEPEREGLSFSAMVEKKDVYVHGIACSESWNMTVLSWNILALAQGLLCCANSTKAFVSKMTTAGCVHV